MPKKLKRSILLVFTLVSTLAIFLISCEDDIEKEAVQNRTNAKFKIEIHDAGHVLQENEDLKKLIGDFKDSSVQSRLISQTYNFEIDEEYVQVIDFEDYTTYTFKIERETNTPNLIENYTIKVVDGTIIEHYLIQYPYELNTYTGEKEYLNNEASMITLENPSWIPHARLGCPPGTVPILVEAETTYTSVTVNCTGGNHAPGDSTCNCGKTDFTCTPGYTYQQPNTVFTWGCSGGSINDGNTDGLTSGLGNGGSGGNTGSNNNNTTTTVPFEDEKKPEEECKRIKEFLDNNTVFRDSIIALAQTAPTATAEKAITLQSDGTQTTHNGVNGKVEVPPNPNKSYNAIMHIHDGSNTYSIYSAGDLLWTGQVSVLNNKINLRNFISFLATGKGTYYAFTITNTRKFNDFFNFLKWQKPSITPQQRMEFLDLAEKKQKIWDKYYRNNPVKILETSLSSEKENELSAFLDLLNELDSGITVFESDANFSNFTPLQKNPISGAIPKIIRKQCQN